MKVSLRLLGFMIASAFFNYWTTAVDYNRMQKCDKDGWFCRSHSDGYEVTYKCPPSNPVSLKKRIEIWSNIEFGKNVI